MRTAGICEKGSIRRENQDAILMCNLKESGLFIVADGVGGSGYGREASEYLVSCFEKWWENHFSAKKSGTFGELFESVKERAELANKELYHQYGKGNGCTTVALLFIHKGIFGYLSSGDSRIYRCNRKGARLLTRDDVWENQPDRLKDASNRGKILSAVGGAEYLEYSCATDRLLLGESFILCSDGIYKFVKEEFIFKQLEAIRRGIIFDAACLNRLAEAAVKNKTSDNYSLIAVKIGI